MESNPNLLSAFPNPAQTNVTFSYQLPKNDLPAELQAFDINGNLIFRKMLNTEAGPIDWNVEHLADGLYYYTILMEQEIYPAQRLMIIRD